MNGKMPNLDREYLKSVEFMTKFFVSIVTNVKSIRKNKSKESV